MPPRTAPCCSKEGLSVSLPYFSLPRWYRGSESHGKSHARHFLEVSVTVPGNPIYTIYFFPIQNFRILVPATAWCKHSESQSVKKVQPPRGPEKPSLELVVRPASKKVMLPGILVGDCVLGRWESMRCCGDDRFPYIFSRSHSPSLSDATPLRRPCLGSPSCRVSGYSLIP
jgi:hypothetical protein